MSRTRIPDKIVYVLWGKAAGRCEYDGCNKPIWFDDLTKYEFNSAYVAHIIADSPDGPRGDPVLSEKLATDPSNLMLMCDTHHRLIDREQVERHPPERLRAMKLKHEARMEILTGIKEEQRSHIILYGANTGEQMAPVSYDKAAYAMIPGWYPADRQPIELGFKNSSFRDWEPGYWPIERDHLNKQFQEKVVPRLQGGNIQHLSIFAFGPQPMLIHIGRLLSDIPTAEVYQLHREPPDWKWQEFSDPMFRYAVTGPQQKFKTVALNLSLSASIEDARITSVVGEDVSIWRLTVPSPHNDFLKGRNQLVEFRRMFRLLLNEVKATHGEDAVVHVFPAVPVAIAVDIGRVWMPKADLPLVLWDQNNRHGRFIETFKVELGGGAA